MIGTIESWESRFCLLGNASGLSKLDAGDAGERGLAFGDMGEILLETGEEAIWMSCWITSCLKG